MTKQMLMKGAIAAATGISMFAMSGGIAFADLADYLNNPGRQQATAVGAQCGTGAGSGAFGFFGKDNNLAGGANGPATGLANSSICGNR